MRDFLGILLVICIIAFAFFLLFLAIGTALGIVNMLFPRI